MSRPRKWDHWYDAMRDPMRLDQWDEVKLPGSLLETAMRDYLEHFGELVELLDGRLGIAEEGDAECAIRARGILHGHLIAISMLLHKIDAHEWYRSNDEWLDNHPEHAAAVERAKQAAAVSG